MILHSIIAMDDIFCKNNVNAPMFQELNGSLIQFENYYEEQERRACSTNPYNYLDKTVNNGHKN